MECMELNIGIVRTFSSLKMTLGVSMEQKTMVQNSVREGRGERRDDEILSLKLAGRSMLKFRHNDST